MSYYQRRRREEAPRMSRRKRFALYGGAILVVLALIGLIGGTLSYNLSNGIERTAPYSSGSDNVAVIHVSGTIEDQGVEYDQEWIERTIQNARYDKDNKGILLKINSPGGSAYCSDETYLALKEYKKATKRPIYAYCEQLTASGGYYIAAAADEIIANRNSLVGSIGVIGAQLVDARGLLDKLGVKVVTIHSGANKLMGSFSEPITEEQKAIWQSITDETYNQFVSIVAKGRHLTVDETQKLADGRIYTANQAKNNGLIDGIMGYETYKSLLEQKKGLQKAKFIDYTYTQGTNGLLRYLKSNVKPRRSELGDAVETLEKMHFSEPMLLYQG